MLVIHDARLSRLALSVVVNHSEGERAAAGDEREMRDLLVDVAPEATVDDLTQALAVHFGKGDGQRFGLLRKLISWAPGATDTASAGYLPKDLLLSECGLFDGVTLFLSDPVTSPAPELLVDVRRTASDLFLIDERGTHRGRVTRLPRGVEITVGRAPAGDRILVVDDQQLPDTVMRLVNRDGEHVACTVAMADGLFVSGTPASAGDQKMLLPGGSISIRRDDTDFVSFTLTTLAGLNHRSSIGKIRFDPTARLADPVYRVLPENLTRLEAQPSPPEHQPFPFEQIVVPLAIVAALWMATGSALTLLISPIAAAVPIINYFRQQRLAQNRYRDARQKWVDKLERISAEHTKAAGAEERNLHQENPPLDTWTRRGYRRLSGLWGRTPERADFLQVGLGYGQLPSRYEIKLADGVDIEDDDFKRVMEIEGRKIERDAVRVQLFDVPITVSLREHHLGIVGPSELVGYLATSVLLQAVCAQAPGAVGLAALLPSSELVLNSYDWLKWLPHTLAGSTLLPSSRVFAGRDSGNAFLVAMRDLHQERHRYRLDESDETFALLVVHEAAEIDIALLDEICVLANGQIRVLWLGSSVDTAPQLVTSVVQLNADDKDESDSTGVVLSGDPALVHRPFALSLFRAAPVHSVRALAPLYDPRSSGANAGIPRRVPLTAVIPVTDLAYDGAPRQSLGTSLSIPLGVIQEGTFELDLVNDGPHVLIGGTTGSGKSELLQTMTCGLVGRYGPHEATLFLVDFKGGATFSPFKDLPHVIGYVSDLDQRNVDRALGFLRAELRRRERAFEEMGHAKDYNEYLTRALGAARPDVLPRLVVFFDEFATIVQEFERTTMPAVIDIAQRGRSWGVHLVLATQQPTRDVVVPKVRSNVNARIALRTLSADDSVTIIDRPDATRIPRALPGRAMARLEGNNIIEFQTAYAGTRFADERARAKVGISSFNVASVTGSSPAGSSAGGPVGDQESQLQRLVSTVCGLGLKHASGARIMPEPLESAPRRQSTVDPNVAPGRARGTQPADAVPLITVGLVDLPRQQAQHDVVIDLAQGGFCVSGPNGSGRTSTLLMVAEAFVSGMSDRSAPGVVCLDGGGDLGTQLEGRWRSTATVAIARSEHVTRLVDQLWLVMRSRMSDDAEDLPIAYRGTEPILMLIDGYDSLGRVLSPPGLSTWYARMVDLLIHGRRYGIHSAIATRSLRDLDPTVLSAMGVTFQLHAHYEEAGTAPEERLPGFALDSTDNLVQFYRPPPRPSSPSDGLDADLARFLDANGWRVPIGGEPTAVAEGVLPVGIDELSRADFAVDLCESHLLVVGASRSGRTSLLRAMARRIHAASGCPVGFFSPRALEDAPESAVHHLSVEDVEELGQLHEREERAAFALRHNLFQLPDGRPLILVDDCHVLEAYVGAQVESVLSSLHARSHVQIVGVTTAQAAIKGALTGALRSGGVTVYLKPSAIASDTDDGWRVRSVSFQHRPGLIYKRGDAIAQTETGQHVIFLGNSTEVGTA